MFITFSCKAPLFVLGLGGRGADTVMIGLTWVGDCSNRSAEERVRLRLCCLVWTLGCHGFGSLVDLARFLVRRAAPSKVGWTPSLRIRPGFPQKVDQLSTKPTSLSGHHLKSQRRNDDRRLNMSSLVILGRGPEKTTESDIVFANLHTDSGKKPENIHF